MLRLSEEAERTAKESGAYYTPDPVAAALVQWAAHNATDRLLDPSCGDGRFIACHPNSTGVERDEDAVSAAQQRAPSGVVHQGDFFEWAEQSTERFDCAAGNPPFIRYQIFSGEVRRRALRLCHDLGASFSGLTTSWAPFLVVTNGVRRAGIDWPCTPRGSADRLSSSEFRRSADCPDSREVVPASLRGLLVVVRRRIRRVDPRHPLRADGAISGHGSSSACRGACAGRGVAQLVEPQAATLSARRLPACNLSGGGQEAGHVAPRYRRIGRNRLRERRQRLFPPAALGGTTVGYPG